MRLIGLRAGSVKKGSQPNLPLQPSNAMILGHIFQTAPYQGDNVAYCLG